MAIPRYTKNINGTAIRYAYTYEYSRKRDFSKTFHLQVPFRLKFYGLTQIVFKRFYRGVPPKEIHAPLVPRGDACIQWIHMYPLGYISLHFGCFGTHAHINALEHPTLFPPPSPLPRTLPVCRIKFGTLARVLS